MHPDHYASMRRSEDRHWWYVANRAIVQALLDRAMPTGPIRSLDAGCGTGANLVRLADRGPACGIDLAPEALVLGRTRGIERLARASVADLPFADATFDLVTCFEVLYHQAMPDWRAAIAGFGRVLRPGGVLLLREPAFPFLYGHHDRVVHGARRFRRRELADAVAATGLRVEQCSYQNLVTFGPALVLRSWERLSGAPPPSDRGDLGRGAGPANTLLGRILALEGRWLCRANLPFGSSVVCLARRR